MVLTLTVKSRPRPHQAAAAVGRDEQLAVGGDGVPDALVARIRRHDRGARAAAVPGLRRSRPTTTARAARRRRAASAPASSPPTARLRAPAAATSSRPRRPSATALRGRLRRRRRRAALGARHRDRARRARQLQRGPRVPRAGRVERHVEVPVGAADERVELAAREPRERQHAAAVERRALGRSTWSYERLPRCRSRPRETIVEAWVKPAASAPQTCRSSCARCARRRSSGRRRVVCPRAACRSRRRPGRGRSAYRRTWARRDARRPRGRSRRAAARTPRGRGGGRTSDPQQRAEPLRHRCRRGPQQARRPGHLRRHAAVAELLPVLPGARHRHIRRAQLRSSTSFYSDRAAASSRRRARRPARTRSRPAPAPRRPRSGARGAR